MVLLVLDLVQIPRKESVHTPTSCFCFQRRLAYSPMFVPQKDPEIKRVRTNTASSHLCLNLKMWVK